MQSSRFILLALFLPATACGQPELPAPWQPLFVGPEALVSVDTSQIERAEHGVKLWVRFDYRTPSEMPGEPEKAIGRVDMMDRLDCAAGTVNNLWMRTWDPAGTLLSDEAVQSRWRTIREHPLGGNVYPRLCAWLANRGSR